MKDNKTEQNQRSWRTTALTTAVLMALSITSISVSNAANNKKIGDLEIYKAAEGGNVTIMMMLDTSGSMTNNQVDYACDLPENTSFRKGDEWSNTTPKYKRDYCTATTKVYYFAKYNPLFGATRWYRCGDSGSGSLSTKSCGEGISSPSIAGYSSEGGGLFSGMTYYYKVENKKVYDRLTRLKDAIFTLMNSEQLDSNKVAIGIGQYSSQSNANNSVEFNSNGTAKADGKTGKILVPAALLDEAQRTKIKTVVADAGGGNGTPTANAYAEAGAYMLGTNTSSSEYSGFKKSVTSSKDGSNYDSPLDSTTASCDGRGIYFLTDGVPNSSPTPTPLMQSALGSKGSSFTGVSSLPQGSNDNSGKYTGGMPAVGAFAKALRDPEQNPRGANGKILTAVVGFGSDFDVDRTKDATLPEADRVIRTLSYTNARGEEETGEFYNCNNIEGVDAKNACNWGAKSHSELTGVGGFGEGGFYSAQSTDDIVNSIITFVADLNQTLSSAPSGTITIPDDPYQVSNQLAYAYLPMLAPNISSKNSIWKGNLKKYNLDQGTLFGKSDKPLYTNVAGDISTTTQDIWQTADFKNAEGGVANNDISAGGVYAKLKTPTSGLSNVRTVYVEDVDTDDKTPKLRKVAVDSSGKGTGFAELKASANSNPLNKRRLLSFLGFDNITIDGNQTTLLSAGGEMISQITMLAPSKEIKLLGGVVHSTPTAVSYSATLDDKGRITDTRDDYVLFGSMDGALHLVDADTGEEAFAIIPKLMMETQPEALVPNSTKDSIGQPYFGVDAPWLVTTDYKYDLDNKKVSVDDSTGNGMFAYGGLRMGGEAFYGMDITKSTAPKIMFSITPQGINGNASSDFARLGQIWNKPTAAKVRLTKDADPVDVLVFGGGYDMAYEDDGYVPISTTPAKGNAIYIINANTGALITSLTTSNNSTMIHSITGEITILDRDNDGLMDHLYAADLGGQVFRADFINARPEKFGFSAVENFSTKRVTRILDTVPIDKKFAYRFYERPVVSFYRSEGGTNNGNIFALVNVISGNRSSPLSTLRSNNDNANRVYGIIDTDVGRSDLFTAADTSLGMNNSINEGSLVNLAATLGNTPTEDKKKQAKALLLGTAATSTTASVAAKKGWYYPLTRFDGYNNVRYNKGVGDSVVINNLLYTTVYNPDKQYGTVDSCSAKITGGSERQVYCLPYGICMDSASTTGTGGFTPAGQGIQELTLGAFNKDNTNLKVLIGTTTITDRILADNRNNYNAGGQVNNGTGIKVDSNIKGTSGATVTGGDGSAVEYIFNERYTLQPRAWYERQQ